MTKLKEKILIIEDDKSILKFLKTILAEEGYEITYACSGGEALIQINTNCPNLILLDLGLPDIDGINIIDSVRSWTQLPIVVVSARSHESEKVKALDKGADDYITKPFSPAELLARIRVALRRHKITNSGETIYSSDNLIVDYEKHVVLLDGKEIHLTQNEFRIISLLSRNSGKVLTYDFIMKEVWGPQSGDNNQILRVNMANIRRKIEQNPADPKYLYTEVGVGYRMKEGN